MIRLEPGDAAPFFALLDQAGRKVSLTDYSGRRLLIFFYPQADTPGCTIQSVEVRDAKADLDALGADVVGISPDTPDEQAAFDQKFSLGFPLLSDIGHKICDAYGVWGQKGVDGNEYDEAVRSSFLIGPDGLVEHAWYKVTPQDTVPNARRALS